MWRILGFNMHERYPAVAIIITTCAPSDPKDLWEVHKESLSEDLLHQARRANSNVEIQFSTEIFNEALVLIEDKCIEVNNKTLFDLGLPAPTRSSINVFDKDLQRETKYNIDQLKAYVENNKKNIN